MYVHVFGAYFGLAVAKVLQGKKEIESTKESSHYHSDLFSMIGTLFLWLYWPSFNSATAKEEGQLRAIVNTYLAISASCVTTYIISLFVGKGRLNMVVINSTFNNSFTAFYNRFYLGSCSKCHVSWWSCGRYNC